ncbi:hypothetical protein Nepgr_005832 [Nepenthes gracilis]|uniref:Uncharacterized protein n=1 Tax=Nepenthes gracilis TaxID=150966 RepID=A0AAD3S412_NEPGR|nr:hypothetical protein Nepgr_005832 [Nepenthes gracilis]
MRKNSICLLLVVVLVAVSMHTSLVQCRKLGPEEAMISSCEQGAAGIVSFAVSANNSSSSTNSIVSSLRFVLASGPSKKGGGH